MSEVAGRMSIQEGAKYLERPQEGRGILLAGVPGVAPAEVAILGGGVVGSNAAKVAAGLGANVRILDVNLDRLRYLDDIMPPNVTTLYSDRHTILESIERADLVIGAVLITGARAPRLVRREDLARMKHGAVIVDVAIDQGGCVETSRPTTHRQPDLRRRRRGPLLRDQHARGGRPDQHLRPLQRDAPLRPPVRQQRLAAGRRGRSRASPRGSTSTGGASPTGPSPRPSACPTSPWNAVGRDRRRPRSSTRRSPDDRSIGTHPSDLPRPGGLAMTHDEHDTTTNTTT